MPHTNSVLIIGGDGLIGKSLAEELLKLGYSVLSTTRRRELVSHQRPYLDFTDINTIDRVGKLRHFDHAVICGGATSINSCEQHPIETYITNTFAPTRIAQHLLDNGTSVIFLSTSAVFDGSKVSPVPTDTPLPYCTYGRQKLEAEAEIQALGGSSTIIRLTKVVGKKNTIFSQWIRLLRSDSPIFAFSDVFVAPISLNYCTNVIIYLLQSSKRGIIHIGANRQVTYLEIARYIARRLQVSSYMVKAIENGTKGVFAVMNASLGGLININCLSPPPSPFEAIEELIIDEGAINV